MCTQRPGIVEMQESRDFEGGQDSSRIFSLKAKKREGAGQLRGGGSAGVSL